MLRVWVRGVVPTGFWWGNLRERDHVEAQALMEGNIKLDLQEIVWDRGLD